MSEKGMKILHFEGRLQRLKAVEHKLCESCIFGKQKHFSFLKTEPMRKSTKLELVHTEVCWPVKVSSLDGSRYYVTFIDDSSRKVLIFTNINHKFFLFSKLGRLWLKRERS